MCAMLSACVPEFTRPTYSSISLGLFPAASTRVGRGISLGAVISSPSSICGSGHLRCKGSLELLPTGIGMERSRINSAGLLAAVVAAALILLLAHTDFGFLTTAGGLTLLFVLFAFDREGRRSVFQSLAFGAVCGFCLMLVAGIIFQYSVSQSNPDISASARQTYFDVRLSAVWAFTTVLLWAIDRGRMSSRATYEAPAIAAGAPGHRQFVPEFTGSFPAVAPPQPAAPPPPRPAPAPAPEYREPAAAPPPITGTTFWTPPTQRPITATTFSAPPTPAPAPAPPPPQPAMPPPPAPVAPAPVPIPSGKETMIYVNLMGEGLNVLRSVRAEHLGRDFYKIIEATPEGETWEYSAGQVVRCKKQKLSSGKALVAFEEAPRS